MLGDLLTRLGNADKLSDKRLEMLFSPKEAEGQLKVDLICYTIPRLISTLVLSTDNDQGFRSKVSLGNYLHAW